MHRTNVDHHVDHLFVDVVPGVTPGTVDSALDANAWQEELANVVEMTGGTLAADGEADAASGWHQVYDAIFAGENLDTGALAEGAVTAEKLALPLGLTAGGIYTFELGPEFLEYVLEGSPGFFKKAHHRAGVTEYENFGVASETDGRGARYSNGPGNDEDFKAAYLRKAAYVLTEETWTEVIASSGLWRANSAYTTDIPGSVGVEGLYGITVRYETVSGGYAFGCLSCSASVSGGFLRLADIVIHGSPYRTPGLHYTIVVEYDASTVTVT